MSELKLAGPYPLGVESVHDLMDLERQCFAYHWTEEQYKLGLERGAFRVHGIREGNRLIGYVAFSMIVDEMEILNIAVHPEFRRKRLGEALLISALDECAKNGIVKGFLDVKVSNTPAISLYEKYGFVQIGVRKKYYPDTGEDALLYRKDF